MKTHLFSFLSVAALAAPVHAQTATELTVTAPWVRATVPAQKSTGAFMHLLSLSPARLVKVSSPAATTVELHKMEMTGGTMRMGPVAGIDLPAHKGVNLASGGYHVMLVGLKKQLKEGDTVDLTLEVSGKSYKPGSTVTIKVPVKPINFVSPGQAPLAH